MGLKDILLGNYSKRQLKKIEPIKQAVLDLEEKYKDYTDEQLRECTEDFKDRVQTGTTLDEILPEAFAVCREAADRVLGMRPYPVQIVGGIVLHQGRIAEMKTGEGKTLVATMPAYLNALAGKGVHIVTVNDYLAKRDSEWMGKLYRFLGLKVGLIVHDLSPQERKAAYDADITYCTNNELGFDYLRDNMVNYKENRVQRGHSFAIVDEVDSILIDEARTPLIISGQGEKSTELYTLAERFAKSLTYKKVKEVDAKADNDEEYAGIDCIVDEKAKTATLTAQGIDRAEQFFHVSDLNDTESDPKNLEILHHINQALRAHGIMQKDIDYVVKDGEVIIVDEFTGRLMFGRRYNEGLHQAIEAKEGVKIENESKTLATITFQNFFRLYDKLSGMTGTAMTESQEFSEIYKLDVVEIPTNKPLARKDEPDVVYKTEQAKFNAVIDNIVACHEKGQPVLVGTISIEKSEHLSKMLKARKIPHNVLNAKNHEKEAEIIAQAGKFGAVTIATNMAGRGTDIILGGNAEYMATAEMRKRGIPDDIIAEAKGFAETDNEEILEARTLFTDLQAQYKEELAPEAEKVLEAGGLYIIGTERHESRRIDNQLRGRAGRQGDVGQSKFYVSLEDDLMRLFGGERLYNMMEKLKVEDDMPIEAGILGKTIENAQQKIEYRNFTQRKNVLEYDDVMNVQRTVIYKERNQVLDGDDIHDQIIKMIDSYIDETAKGYFAHDLVEDWDFDGLKANLASWLPADDIIDEQTKDLNDVSAEGIIDALCERAHEHIAEKEGTVGENTMRELERVVLLYAVDTHWMDHIDAMDELRNGIRLRAYGQQDPVVAYRNEGYDMFEAMNSEIREDTVKRILTVQIRNESDMERKQVAKITSESGASDESEVKKQPVRVSNKIGRNDPCPCGSGKKYKKCCGRDAE